MLICLSLYSKIQELEEELKVVGNNMKSLEVSEAEVRKREEGREEGRFLIYRPKNNTATDKVLRHDCHCISHSSNGERGEGRGERGKGKGERHIREIVPLV